MFLVYGSSAGPHLGVAVVVDAVDQQLVDAVQKVAPVAGQLPLQLRVVRRHPQRPRVHRRTQRLQLDDALCRDFCGQFC